MVISLGLMSILPALVILLTGTEGKAVPPYVDGVLTLGGVSLPWSRLFTMGIGLLVFVGVLIFVWKNREGRALSAMSQNIDSAKLNGVNLVKSDAIGFALGFGLAALSAAILAPLFYVDATLGSAVFLKTFIIVILGGLGSIPGTLVGGLIVGFIDGFGQAFLPGGAASLVSFLLVVVILAIRPQGLMGKDI
jgi:branched-chain amino acid transport system permease protein